MKHKNNNKVEYEIKMQEKHLFLKVVKNNQKEHQAEKFEGMKFWVNLKLLIVAVTSERTRLETRMVHSFNFKIFLSFKSPPKT